MPSCFIGHFDEKGCNQVFSSTGDTIPIGLNPRSRQPRMEGYSNDHIERHPYVVSIQRYGKHICGGSIHSENVVLTSAHCIRDSSILGLTVRAGTSNWKTGGSEHEVIYARLHEDYRENSPGCKDVALLKLRNSIKLDNKTTQAIDLFEKNEVLNDTVTATAMGWGRTQGESLTSLDYLWYLVRYPFYGRDKSVLLSNDLRSIVLHTMSSSDCRKISNWCVEDFICTDISGKVICKGDSGGPLVVHGRQVGIATASGGCGMSERLKNNSIFTNVALYRDWIDKYARILSLI
ncbi:hypothetical protein QAD02_003814 [Eretmocerus hayati]|uniref:Uncharacterized protein n=1 Tax=Eretmocerus hayati TaxID=131215 RepID=A0ACC2NSM9_9HYME|nr:hypothetical protein QAD02_003814 [Eretmocerus hayati]